MDIIPCIEKYLNGSVETLMIEVDHKNKTVEIFPHIDGWSSTDTVDVIRVDIPRYIKQSILLYLFFYNIQEAIKDIPEEYKVI